MQMVLDPDSGVPLYVQVVHGLTEAIASRLLEEGEELPSVRALGGELRVNYHTVARAYRELEAAGWIERQRGGPYRVVGRAQDAADALLEEDLEALCRHAEARGLDDEALIARVLQARARLRTADAGGPAPPDPKKEDRS